MPARKAYAVRRNVKLGRDAHIGVGTVIEAPHLLTIGDRFYVGKYCTIEVNGSIGHDVLIGNQVGLVGRHDHDFTALGVPVRGSPWIGDVPNDKSDYLEIESDVWIGFGAIVLSGTKVGRGSIVAAGSIVVHDVGPYAIVAGQPAKKIGERFAPSEIEEHERILRGKYGY